MHATMYSAMTSMLIYLQYITPEKQEAAYVKLRSTTEQSALDEFLSTAELAGTDFTAEKLNNVKIIHRDQNNPFLLSTAEERAKLRKQEKNRNRLRVPRRPAWDEHTTKVVLEEQERQALVQWRRGLAELVEGEDLLMTPFERNLEVWRQLWRVLERSDLVVQIVDARNPLLFRCEDLENYVKEVDPKKRNLLLVNKADMMTLEQRQAWADYFVAHNINFRFFSAELAKEMNEAREFSDSEEEDDEDTLDADEIEEEIDPEVKDVGQDMKHLAVQETTEKPNEAEAENGSADDIPATDEPSLSSSESVRILTVDELEALFLEHAPQTADRKINIGLVGYPNVGKSSTINALMGAKKVSVSATPGKTKHFQTLHLSDDIILCDCPGLVFPNFASTKAELVCNGILPIDQLREFTGPAGLVAQRIPQSFLEAIYGMKIHIRPFEEGGTGVPTASEVLAAYASARGFSTQGLGMPDESRAARYILKDYVKGKLLFCHPPPAVPEIDPKHFNRELYDAEHLPEKRRFAFLDADDASVAQSMTLTDDAEADAVALNPSMPIRGEKSTQLDKRFFAPKGTTTNMSVPFHHQYTEQGKQLSGRKQKTMVALENDVDPRDVQLSSKKHFKGNKRGKVRGAMTFE